MASKIELPDVSESLLGDGGVQFPRPILYPYIKNGNPDFEQLGGVLWLGGWAAEAEKFEWFQQEHGGALTGWKKVKEKRKGNEYFSYVKSDLWLAPIKGRVSWVNKGTRQRSTERFANSRLHLQEISALAEKTADAFKFVDFVVVSMVGYQVSNFRYALKAFSDATASMRLQLGNVDAKFFYKNLGMNKPNFESVGKKETSEINPIASLALPKDADELATWYIANDVIADAATLIKDANEWLDAWKNLPPIIEGNHYASSVDVNAAIRKNEQARQQMANRAVMQDEEEMPY